MLLVFDETDPTAVPNLAVPSGGVKTHLVTLTRDASRVRRASAVEYGHQFHPRDATVAPRAVMPPRPEGNALSSDERCSSRIATIRWSRSTPTR